MTTHPYRPPPSAISPSRVTYAVVVLTLINLINYLDRFVLPSVLQNIRTELHFSYKELGLLGSAFIVVYTAISPIFGRLGDSRSRRGLIALGIALWSVASASGGLMYTFVGMLAARAAVGVGEAAYATISPSLISDYFPPERRGRVMAVFFAAIPLGSGLGYVLGGVISAKYGWRHAFLLTGIPGLILAVAALFMQEPRRGIQDHAEDTVVPPFREALRVLRKSREFVWAVAGYTAVTFGLGGLSFWMPTYLHAVRDVPVARAGTLVGAFTVVGGLLGTLVGGWLGEIARRKMPGGYFFVCGWSTALAGILAVAMFAVHDSTLMYLLLFLSVFLVFVSTGPVNTILVNSIPATVRATGSAVTIFCIHMFGDAGAPSLIGAVADLTSMRTAVLLVPIAIGLGGIIWIVGRKRITAVEITA